MITKKSDSSLVTAPPPVSASFGTPAAQEPKKTAEKSYDYEAEKNNRILIQGILQSVIASPGMACFRHETPADLEAAFKATAIKMIEFAREEIKKGA